MACIVVEIWIKFFLFPRVVNIETVFEVLLKQKLLQRHFDASVLLEPCFDSVSQLVDSDFSPAGRQNEVVLKDQGLWFD